MLERAKEATRKGKYTYVEYARFAEQPGDLDRRLQATWLADGGGGKTAARGTRRTTSRDQRGENFEPSTSVEARASAFWGSISVRCAACGAYGVLTTRPSSKSGRRCCGSSRICSSPSVPTCWPRREVDQPGVAWMGELLRSRQHSSECFSFVKDWVEKKVRRHMQRARNRRGFNWKRWSKPWMYDELGLFNGYRVARPQPKAAPAG